MRHQIGAAAMAAGLTLLTGYHGVFAQEFAGREQLRAHSAEFRQEVIKVTDGVYVAVGFSLGRPRSKKC